MKVKMSVAVLAVLAGMMLVFTAGGASYGQGMKDASIIQLAAVAKAQVVVDRDNVALIKARGVLLAAQAKATGATAGKAAGAAQVYALSLANIKIAQMKVALAKANKDVLTGQGLVDQAKVDLAVKGMSKNAAALARQAQAQAALVTNKKILDKVRRTYKNLVASVAGLNQKVHSFLAADKGVMAANARVKLAQAKLDQSKAALLLAQKAAGMAPKTK